MSGVKHTQSLIIEYIVYLVTYRCKDQPFFKETKLLIDHAGMLSSKT